MTIENLPLDKLEEDEAERQELLDEEDKYAQRPRVVKQGDNDAEKRLSSPGEEEEDDPIADIIGNYGLWQLKMTFLLSLCSFPCTFHIFSPTFIATAEDFWCVPPDSLSSVPLDVWRNFSQPLGGCYIGDMDWSTLSPNDIYNESLKSLNQVKCQRRAWNNRDHGTTIVSDWDLVCDRQYLNTLTEVLFLAGVAIGGVISGLISDRFGRKRTLVAALVMQSVFAVSLTFCPWYELYLILRILLGFFCVSVVFAGFVLAVELVGGKWRTIAGVCNFFPLPVSYMLVSAISLGLPNWRHLQLALSIPGIFLIALWWIVPESPRWLLTMGRMSEVKEIVIEAAKYNKREIPTSLDKILQPDNKPKQEVQKEHGLIDLVKPPITKITVCVFIAWGACTIVYYGLVLNISSFGGDLHITSIISGLVELPAIALSMPVLLKMGRRYPISFSAVFAGVGCCAAAVVKAIHDVTWLRITLVMISKFSISATNGVLPMYTAELYPTLMRNMGVGASQVIAGICLVCIPYIWTIPEPYPLAVMGAIGVIGGFCILLLPETANKSLNSVGYDENTNKSEGSTANQQNGPYSVSSPQTTE